MKQYLTLIMKDGTARDAGPVEADSITVRAEWRAFEYVDDGIRRFVPLADVAEIILSAERTDAPPAPTYDIRHAGPHAHAVSQRAGRAFRGKAFRRFAPLLLILPCLLTGCAPAEAAGGAARDFFFFGLGFAACLFCCACLVRSKRARSYKLGMWEGQRRALHFKEREETRRRLKKTFLGIAAHDLPRNVPVVIRGGDGGEGGVDLSRGVPVMMLRAAEITPDLRGVQNRDIETPTGGIRDCLIRGCTARICKVKGCQNPVKVVKHRNEF